MSSEPRTVVDDLVERVTRLEYEREVLAAANRYAHALDYGDEAAFVDCFTDDGVYEIRQRPRLPGGAVGRLFVGRDELAAWVPQHTRAPDVYHKHLLVSPLVELEGETATMRSYFLRIDEADGVPYVYAFGRYLDELSRCSDGRWRFTRRLVEIEGRSGLPKLRIP